MRSSVRGRFLILALIILISQSLLLVHATSHLDKDGVVCQLCVSQGQQSHGLPALVSSLFTFEAQAYRADSKLPAIPDHQPPRPYYQRAPPVIT